MTPEIDKDYLFYDADGEFLGSGTWEGTYVSVIPFGGFYSTADIDVKDVYSWIPLPQAPNFNPKGLLKNPTMDLNENML